MMDAISQVVRASRQLLSEIDREPTPEEVAEKLGMPLEKVRKVLKIARLHVARGFSGRGRPRGEEEV